LTDAPAGPATAPTSDVGADLTAAFDAAEGTNSSPKAAESASPSSAKSSPSASASSPDATARGDAGPARGADGKFVKPDGTPTEARAEPTEAKQSPAPKPDGKPDAKPSDAKPAPEFKIPEKWPAEVKARFEALHKKSPEDAQFALEQFNLARSQYAEVEKAKAENAKRGKVLESVEQLLAPGRQQRALSGIDDAGYVRNLVAAGDFLDKNPREGLKYLAKQYGVDLQQLASGGEEPQVPDHVRQLHEENAQIKAALQSFMGQQQQAHLAQVANGIERSRR
jgi:hypothetical protein